MTKTSVVDSPDWVKPCDVRIRKQAKRRLPPRALHKPDSTNDQPLTKRLPDIINPFRKRCSTVNPSEDQASPVSNSICISALVSSAVGDETRFSIQQSLTEVTQQQLQTQCRTLPVDWSIKTKVRFYSPRNFPYNGSLKTTEEASGTTGFVRAMHDSNDTSLLARFHHHCLYWQYPSFPWISLFPRDVRESISTPLLHDENARSSMKAEWCQSFRSLLNLVRARQCAYFYVCAPTFTALFRAAGIGGGAETHALIAPASIGLRRALTNEGIKYTSASTVSTPTKAVDELQVDDANGILESLGLNKDQLDVVSNGIEIRRELLVNEKEPILVERENVQALFNFLVNSSVCFEGVGALAHVPPTLLASVAFHAATLRVLRVKHCWIQPKDKNSSQLHALELSGPVLPNALNSLCALFAQSQERFQVSAASHQPSVAFNINIERSTSPPPTAFAVESLKECGLTETFLHSICAPQANTIRSLSFADNQYTLGENSV